MNLLTPALLILALLLAWVLTGLMRRYALSRQIIDIPNARSSHQAPTPRGGGVAIVLSFGLLITMLAVLGLIETRLVAAP